MDNAVLNGELIATKAGNITVYNYDGETREYISASTEYLAVGVGKVEADSRPSVDTHPSGVQPSPGTGRHPAPQLYAVCSPGGTSLYPCFRLVSASWKSKFAVWRNKIRY